MGSDSISHFEKPQSRGNDSEARKLGSVRVEAERRRFCSMSNVSKPVKTYLETLKWEVLSHRPYFQDVAPSDYHLFRSITHGLAHQHFRSYEEVKKLLDSWIASKDASFFRDGI